MNQVWALCSVSSSTLWDGCASVQQKDTHSHVAQTGQPSQAEGCWHCGEDLDLNFMRSNCEDVRLGREQCHCCHPNRWRKTWVQSTLSKIQQDALPQFNYYLLLFYFKILTTLKLSSLKLDHLLKLSLCLQPTTSVKQWAFLMVSSGEVYCPMMV